MVEVRFFVAIHNGLWQRLPPFCPGGGEFLGVVGYFLCTGERGVW